MIGDRFGEMIGKGIAAKLRAFWRDWWLAIASAVLFLAGMAVAGSHA